MRADVTVVGVLQIGEDGIGFGARLGVILVIHDRDLESFLGGNLLHQGIGLVFEVVMLAVPVDDESGDAKLFGLVNLLLHDHAILGRIANVDMSGLSKPWQIGGQHHGLTIAADEAVGGQRGVNVSVVTSGAQEQDEDSRQQSGPAKMSLRVEHAIGYLSQQC